MLCVVEDAHWLDSATADALLFCARRLGADRVLLVFSARDGAATPFRPDGIGELQLTGLDPAAARELLDQRPGDAPAPEVTERLIAESGGQPAGPAGAPDRAQRGPARRLLAAAGAAAPHHPRRAGLPRPQPAAAAAGAVTAAARGRRRHRRPRRRTPRRIDARCGRAGSRGRRGLRTPHRRVGVGARCVTHSSARPSTRPPPASNAAQVHQRAGRRLGRSRRLRPRGVASRRSRRRARPRGRGGSRASSRPVPSVAEAYAAAMTAYERAAALSTEPPQRAALTFAAARTAWACGQAAAARALLATARAAADRPGPAQRHRASERTHRGQHRLGHRRSPDLHRRRPRRPRRRPRCAPWRWPSPPPSCAPTRSTAAPPCRPATSSWSPQRATLLEPAASSRCSWP